MLVCNLFIVSYCVLLRLVQVEMFAVTTPEDSERVFEEMVGIQKELYTLLGLHFR